MSMMTLMCPNCNRHFPMAGCCNPTAQIKTSSTTMKANDYENFNSNNFETSLDYNRIPEYFTNLPTIINTRQSNDKSQTNNTINLIYNKNLLKINSNNQSTSTNNLTNGIVTVTPSIQTSGGCLIQTTDSSTPIKASKIAIRPNLSGGGCVVQKNCSINQYHTIDENICLTEINYFDENINFNEIQKMWMKPTSNNCSQELQGSEIKFSTIESLSSFPSLNHHYHTHNNHHRQDLKKAPDCPNDHHKQFLSNCYSASRTNFYHGNTQQCSSSSSSSSCDNSLQIQVNATVQLPINISECTVNITATTTTANSDTFNNIKKNTNNLHNFNGGGIVQNDDDYYNNDESNCENEDCDDSPITPISYLMPCSWIFNTDWQNNDYTKISDIKNLLQISGWYYEELSWQQSENLLKNTKVGTWLMRNSSDNRYTFAVSVQTSRGPTSVRVLWIFNKFRLDAEAGIAIKMPLFDCPIKMLEYYVDYSKKNDDKSNVWIDSSGKVYSQIYLSQPLSKEIKSLSHLARLAINKNKLSVDHLPPPIKNYIDEYPYTF